MVVVAAAAAVVVVVYTRGIGCQYLPTYLDWIHNEYHKLFAELRGLGSWLLKHLVLEWCAFGDLRILADGNYESKGTN